MTRKTINEVKKIIKKLNDVTSWLDAFAEVHGDIEEAEKQRTQFLPNSNQILAIKTALASQILIMSLALSEGSGYKRAKPKVKKSKLKNPKQDDQNFGVLQRLLKDTKITNYFCNAVVNKSLVSRR